MLSKNALSRLQAIDKKSGLNAQNRQLLIEFLKLTGGADPDTIEKVDWNFQPNSSIDSLTNIVENAEYPEYDIRYSRFRIACLIGLIKNN